MLEGMGGCPMTDVGKDALFLSSPQVVSGDPSEKIRFPIDNGGNGGEAEGFLPPAKLLAGAGSNRRNDGKGKMDVGHEGGWRGTRNYPVAIHEEFTR
jgi:hypothetical protein